jgi:cell wall-associated NlpC family hydrolase
MAANRVDMAGLAMLATGAIFAYAGLTGKSVLAELHAIVSGQSPATLGQANPIKGTSNPAATPTAPGAVGGGTASGAVIAQDAMQYVGHKYVYGGAPGQSGANGWDCSSFVNWVLNHDLGMSIPGGTWNPNTHGPNTTSYNGWSGANPIPRNQAGAGDLCCWSTHIGIAINNTQMVSALNERLGTQITGIENGGPQGESLTCRRLVA